jgi:NADH:ubiquinone oxidoreductase subunit K
MVYAFVNSLGYILLSVGLWGLFHNRNNLVLYFLCLEILLLGISVLFILTSLRLEDLWGAITAFYILTVSASEVAVGLGLLVSYYISQIDISIKYMKLIRW